MNASIVANATAIVAAASAAIAAPRDPRPNAQARLAASLQHAQAQAVEQARIRYQKERTESEHTATMVNRHLDKHYPDKKGEAREDLFDQLFREQAWLAMERMQPVAGHPKLHPVPAAQRPIGACDPVVVELPPSRVLPSFQHNRAQQPSSYPRHVVDLDEQRGTVVAFQVERQIGVLDVERARVEQDNNPPGYMHMDSVLWPINYAVVRERSMVDEAAKQQAYASATRQRIVEERAPLPMTSFNLLRETNMRARPAFGAKVCTKLRVRPQPATIKQVDWQTVEVKMQPNTPESQASSSPQLEVPCESTGHRHANAVHRALAAMSLSPDAPAIDHNENEHRDKRRLIAARMV